MTLPTQRPEYGVDAPGVIRGLLGGGVAGLAAGAAVRALATARPLATVGAVAGVAALVPLALGLSMLAYARAGKLRLRDWMLDRHAWRGDETVLDIGAGRGLMAVVDATKPPR